MGFRKCEFLSVFTGLIEVLFLSGIFYGWPTIIMMMKGEGVYSELCEDPGFPGNYSYCQEMSTVYVSINLFKKLPAVPDPLKCIPLHCKLSPVARSPSHTQSHFENHL